MMRTYKISPAMQASLDRAEVVRRELARVRDALASAKDEHSALETNISQAQSQLGEQEAAAVLECVSGGVAAGRKKLAQLRSEIEPLEAKLGALRARTAVAESELLRVDIELQSAYREFAAEQIAAFQAELDEAWANFESVFERGLALAHELRQSPHVLRTRVSGLMVFIDNWQKNPAARAISEALSPARILVSQLEREATTIKIKASIPPTVPLGPSVVVSRSTDDRPETPTRAAVPDWLCRNCLLPGPHATSADCERAKAEQPTIVTAGAA